MNAFELLKEDHQKAKSLFEKLGETTERASKTRRELFEKLKHELEVHTKIEEQIFYPALKEADETREITLEAIEEHHVVKQLLQELTSLEPESEQWTAKLKVLQENVEHHIEEEEKEMFQSAREVLSKEQTEALGEQMKQEKEALTLALS